MYTRIVAERSGINIMEIGSFELDMLKEIANIGAGNAAGALSALTNQEVDIDVSECKMIGYSEIAEHVGGAEHVILGILVKLSGDIEGYILLAQGLEDAKNTIKSLMGIEVTGDEFDVANYEAMREVCNILSGTYISALSSMMRLNIEPSVPEMTIDMAMAIMNVPVYMYGDLGEFVLLLDTKFRGLTTSVNGCFFLIPTLDSLQVLKKALVG